MIWEELSSVGKPFFALAPMNDVTDTVFRQMVGRCFAPDVYFTEFVSVDSLNSVGRKAMGQKLTFIEEETPLIVQIWGNDSKSYEIQTRELAGMGFAGVDINMGCPVAKIISKGACSALIKDRGRAKEIIGFTRAGLDDAERKVALSVKTRIGFDSIDLSWIEFLLQQDLDALTVHCRTTEEQSKVNNHFEVLPEIVEMRDSISPRTKLIANGDIASRRQGEDLAEKYGLDGLMLGRAIFSDPFVFAPNSPWENMSPMEKIAVFKQHIDLFESTWQGSKNPDILKKFAKVYVTGFEGATKVRDQIMKQRNIDDVRKVVLDLELRGFN